MANAESTTFDLLSSKLKIERDKGILELQKCLNGIDPENYEQLAADMQEKLSRPCERWEYKHGLLTGCKILAEHVWSADDFTDALQAYAEKCLDDAEYRVRVAAGEALGALCKRNGAVVYAAVCERVLLAIHDGLTWLQPQQQPPKSPRCNIVNDDRMNERDAPDSAAVSPEECIGRGGPTALPLPMRRLADEESAHGSGGGAAYGARSLVLSGSPRTSALMMYERSNPEQGAHDFPGWNTVETWIKCLQFMVEGCSEGGGLGSFNDYVDQQLLDLVITAVQHSSRYAREAGLHLCAAIVACNGRAPRPQRSLSVDPHSSDESAETSDPGGDASSGGAYRPEEESPEEARALREHASRTNAVHAFGDQFAGILALGLADNWSLVRLAACQAAGTFLLAFSLEARQKYFPLLLPRMCLNRYYVVEGIRNYSQESWKQVTESRGREFVEMLITPMVDYYISQTNADNHAVREAACACMSELAFKVSQEAVRPHLGRLVDALLVFLADENWPVRDAACSASIHFVTHYFEELSAQLPTLRHLLQQRLQDNAPVVRQGAAVALAAISGASGGKIYEELLRMAAASFDALESLSETAEADESASSFGEVAAAAAVPGSCSHPRPWELADGYACTKCKSHRPPEAWELAEGCIHLVCALAALPSLLPSLFTTVIERLAHAASCHQYLQHIAFVESVCKQLPNLAHKIGKLSFKKCLNAFLDPIFYALTCESASASSAASQCLNQLSSFVGPDILRGRVEQHNAGYLEKLEVNDAIAPM